MEEQANAVNTDIQVDAQFIIDSMAGQIATLSRSVAVEQAKALAWMRRALAAEAQIGQVAEEAPKEEVPSV